jgi:hypothetical protein
MIKHERISDKRIFISVKSIREWEKFLTHHPYFFTYSLTHPVTHATLHKTNKYKMRQQSEEGSSYVDFYPGA